MVVEPSLPDLRKTAAQKFAHARGCKKAPDACQHCRTTMEWFRLLPANILARILGE